MDTALVKKMAEALLVEHKLDGWRFRFDSAQRRMGCCNYATKTIQISRPYAAVADEEHVRQTLLHEVAHALTPGARHGVQWKAKVVALGGTPKATTDNPLRELRDAAVLDGARPLRDGETLASRSRAIIAIGGRPTDVTVQRRNRTTYTVTADDGRSWRVPLTAVFVPDSAAVAAAPQVPAPAAPVSAFVALPGETVFLDRHHPELGGVPLTVVRCNTKTYTVKTPSGSRWRISPAMLKVAV